MFEGGRWKERSEWRLKNVIGEEGFPLLVSFPRACIIPPIIRSLVVDVKDRGWVFEVLGQDDRADQGRKS